MSIALIVELISLPGVVWLLKALSKRQALTATRFAVIVITYLIVVVSTLAEACSATLQIRIAGIVASLLLLFPGLPLVQRIYRQIVAP